MHQTPSVHSLLQSAALRLNNDEAKLEAQLLLQEALNVNHAWLIAHADNRLKTNEYATFEAMLNRRLTGEPIAYILGYREFYGLKFAVSPEVLIPRPDTETLVEAVLAKIPMTIEESGIAFTVLDLGTGTGAIALAIAKYRDHANITAVDASQAALNVAKLNAKNLAINNVHFMLSHWYASLENRRFDVIVSNPPYIESNDTHLSQGDLRFEPISALASGADGLDDIRQIINDCLIYLKPQGWLMLEHGYNQAEHVTNLMAEIGLTEIKTIQDLSGNDRVTIGKNPLILSVHWD
ncbi:MAG: peptide chain release factor N(5)-glutamine methyltransferase [Methylophilaceae bacterium]